MRNEDTTKKNLSGFGTLGLRDKLRLNLPFAGIPVVMAALLVMFIGRMDTFILLNYEVLTILGYIAAICDIKTRMIPNILVLVMLIAWAILIVPKLFLDTDAALAFILDSVIGFAVGGGLFLLVYLISRKGLGGGDVKLMAGIGLYLGFSKVLPAMLFGSVISALTGLTLILMKKLGRKDSMPLAPFLYIGVLITVFLQ